MDIVFDPDEASTNELNPLVPRDIDLPTTLGVGGIDDDEGSKVKIFSAPTDPAEWPAWRERLAAWRDSARDRLGYGGDAYAVTAAKWASECFSVALVWLWDERLYDHATGLFTVDSFLAATNDYGRFEGVVLWHAYPVIGIDDRNQFDFYREVPDLVTLIAQFQGYGLKVFINYNPWDTGTRRPNNEDPAELAILVGELRVDGVFLDTMREGGADLIGALMNADPPQLLEGESRIQLSRIQDHHLSWAQWFADSEAPGVLAAHWFERRHMMHHTRRWNRDHSSELQSSFMNGTGMLVWDAVFGVWVGWNDRDRATLRTMLRLQRAFKKVLVDGEWTPLVESAPEALANRIYVSRFSTQLVTLFTIINRQEVDYYGAVLSSSLTYPSGAQLFDLSTGAVLASAAEGVTVPARSVSAIVAVTGPIPGWLRDLLHAVSRDGSALSHPSELFPARHAVRREVPETKKARVPHDAVILPAGEHSLTIKYRRRETGMYQGAPYVEEWKPLPPRLHDDRYSTILVELGAVAVAAREVTAADFDNFVTASRYRPQVAHRFPPFQDVAENRGSTPANLVNLADARAFASWMGARLPTEFEWQVAAADPAFKRLRPLVWNWTESEHTDGVTRFVMLKGGSEHQSMGSDWYFDGGPRDPEFTAKFLLPGQGLDRSTSIGFRLCWDLSG